MSEKYTVVHKKSRVVTEGQPKLPSASTIEYGEIAINYAEGYETLSIKNSNNEIATFSSDHVVNSALTEIRDSIDEIQSALTEDELVISTSLSDLNDRVEDLESVSIPYNTSDLNNDSGFITSADTAHTHTAAEVGAMATSERSNYLPTGTTLDNVADGSTRKLSNYSTTAHTHTAAEVGAMATSERSNYLTTATTIPSVDAYFDDVEYDSNTKRINFKHDGTVKDYVDASDFIKDGMVDSVAISTPTGGTNSGVTCLVVTFNTDAGKDDIEIPLSSIFNPSNYYNKTEADEKFLSISAYTEDEEVVASALNDLNDRIQNIYIPQYLSEFNNDIGFVTSAETAHTHTAAEVGAMATSERSNYLPTGTTLDNVADGATRKLANYSLTSHTHSQYATTAHTHTAAEVGAMATSERSNYSTTGHTHAQYATTAHTHTAAEVGAMATSERNNYSTTAHTHTAAEVGAMATSERGNYLPTGTTLDNVADGTTRKLSNYSTTAHSHTAAEVGAMATSERSNYLPTGTTLDNVADGATRKLANYSLTSHTHSEYSTTAHTHDQYATTAQTANFLTSADTEDFITSADTKLKIYDISASTNTQSAIQSALPSDFAASVLSDLNNGILPLLKIHFTGQGNINREWDFTFSTDNVGESTLSFSHVRESTIDNLEILYLLSVDGEDVGQMGCLFRSTKIPTETTISGSGFTKNAITGINVNGTASTVTNGVADITIPSGLPAVTAADNGKILQVVNGAWALVTPTTVYTGSDVPLSSVGNDGDIYLQTS